MLYHLSVCASCFRLREFRTISNPLVVGPSDRRVERLLKTINLRPTLVSDVNTTPAAPAFLSKAGKNELDPLSSTAIGRFG